MDTWGTTCHVAPEACTELLDPGGDTRLGLCLASSPSLPLGLLFSPTKSDRWGHSKVIGFLTSMVLRKFSKKLNEASRRFCQNTESQRLISRRPPGEVARSLWKEVTGLRRGLAASGCQGDAPVATLPFTGHPITPQTPLSL